MSGAAAAALGAALPVLPAPAVVVPPCGGDRALACWEDSAPRLTRFAAPPGLHLPDATADVRLGHDAAGLWVWVDRLPAGAFVELLASPRPDDDRLTVPVQAVLGAGLHRLALPGPPGRVESLRLGLRVPDGAGAALLPWAPAGPGDVHGAAPLVRVAAPPVRFPLAVRATAGGLTVEAAGASAVRARARALPVPDNSRGLPPPWEHSGGAALELRPPGPGWLDLQAVWAGPDGAVEDLARAFVWTDGPPLPAAAQWEGLHPRPRAVDSAAGPPFQAQRGQAVCPGVAGPAAALFVEELARVAGIEAVLAPDTAACAVRFAAVGPGVLPHPDAFRLRVGARGVRVEAASARAFVWAALALVDLLGPDGAAPAAVVTDWPAVTERVLVHTLNLKARPDWRAEDHLRWLRTVAARGRPTVLVLVPLDGVGLPGGPPGAVSAAAFAPVLAEARRLGMEIAPGLSVPAHAEWLIGTDAGLQEDGGAPGLLDLRSPELPAALAAALDRALAWAGPGRFVHLGFDEAIWGSGRAFGDERNPRTAGSPRAFLLAAALDHLVSLVGARGRQPLVWSDLFLPDWNGGREGAAAALAHVRPETRAALGFFAWSPLGDPFRVLAPSPIYRVHTGYLDWKRTGLDPSAPGYAGEGLGLFLPAPWEAFGPAGGSRNLHYHNGSVVLAGTGAWAPDTLGATIDALLGGLADLVAFRPGWRALPAGAAAPVFLGGGLTAVGLAPARLDAGGHRFDTAGPRVVADAAPAHIDLPPGVHTLSLLQHTTLDPAAGQRLLAALRRSPQPVPVATVTFDCAPEAPVPLRFGRHTHRPEIGPRGGPLFDAAAVVAYPSPAAVAAGVPAADHRAWRVDLPLPCPARRAALAVPAAGVRWAVLGAVAHRGQTPAP